MDISLDVIQNLPFECSNGILIEYSNQRPDISSTLVRCSLAIASSIPDKRGNRISDNANYLNKKPAVGLLKGSVLGCRLENYPKKDCRNQD